MPDAAIVLAAQNVAVLISVVDLPAVMNGLPQISERNHIYKKDDTERRTVTPTRVVTSDHAFTSMLRAPWRHNINLKGNTVSITGGTSGIGLEFPAQLTALGNTVIVTARTRAGVDAAVDTVPGIEANLDDVTREIETNVAIALVYCASKCAIHSFSQSLRIQLKDTNVAVFELAPPRTETQLYEEFRAQDVGIVKAMTVRALVKRAIEALARDRYDIRPGMSAALSTFSRIAPNLCVKMLNKRFVR